MKKLSLRGMRHSLMFRVTIIIFIVILAAILILSFYAGNVLSSYSFQTAREDSLQLFEQSGQHITTYINTMENIAVASARDSTILGHLFTKTSISKIKLPAAPVEESAYYSYEDLEAALMWEEHEKDESRYYTDMVSIKAFLINLTAAQENIECVTLVPEAHDHPVDTRNAVGTKYPYKEQAWYQDALTHPDKKSFMSPHIPEYLPAVDYPVITYIYPIRMYESSTPLAMLLIDLNYSTLESILSDLSLGDSGYAFIVNSAGEYIYYPDDRFLSTGQVETPFADAAYIDTVLQGNSSFIAQDEKGIENVVFSTSVDGTDWYLVGVIPYDQLNAPATSLRNTQIIIGLVVAGLVCALLYVFFRSSVFTRLQRLRSHMAEVENGDLNVSFETRRDDEIGKLGEGFNTMIVRLKLLIEDITNTQNQKRKAEFAALQSQINPHFLYNTLDSIVWMAETNPAGASEMAYLLGTFFRQSLSGGNDIIPLCQELAIVEAYLKIQRIRYESYFDYEIHFTQDVANIPLPKLIVQPLVENAIYHGIKQSGRKCMLSIYAFRFEDCVYIQVVDDGVGMTGEELKKVMKKTPPKVSRMNGVGARNVDNRIKLYFTEKSGLAYFSHKDKGTVACIYIYQENTSEEPAGE
ncbi:sensor histidine kinase [Christensenellaceae bacterium OttesenSCG-928-K19]|nr:sensor histidine kinase [Christensenellaceae bacterium OttesenSCG-928-K19]